MPNHTGRLALTASDPFAAPDRDLLVDLLHRVGFIGERLPEVPDGYRVGPRFLDLLVFAGCSVGIADEPGPGPFAHVRIPTASPTPRLLAGRNTRPPRCPGCRARLRDWETRAEVWETPAGQGIACPACGEIHPPWHWDWKLQGGFGRLFVLVEEVFPGEAVPSPELSGLLTRAHDSPWRHFYVQD